MASMVGAASHVEVRIDARADALKDYEEYLEEKEEGEADDFETYFYEHHTDFGSKREYDVQKIWAKIFFRGAAAGHATLTLVPRGGNFHAACDAESGELQEVGVTFFARNGRTPRLEAVKALGPEVGRGAFVYMDSFRIDDAVKDARSDVATEALRQLFSHEALAGEWGLCVYIPEAEPHLTPAERNKIEDISRRELERFMSDFSERPYTRAAPDDARAHEALVEPGIRRDATAFLRVGFQQADEVLRDGKTPYLFASPSALLQTPLGHDAATALVLAKPPAPAEPPTGADLELREYCAAQFGRGAYGGTAGVDADFVAKVGGLVNRGASVVRSNVLHCAAAQDASDHFELLLALGGPGAIDGPDANGYTPLMVAAGLSAGKGGSQVPPSTKTLVKLLERGANKAPISINGKTALGIFWESVRGSNDYYKTFGIVYKYDREGFITAVEALLRPPNGPTPADQQAKDEDEDEDDDGSADY
ncbi:hypothetical protein M885DRAFT_516652 [Pelagophyceae sp. CCMP2097]|nr:hypothetical protein M885DRAFT_516652 [Pelagophyceae sp. CCMP2097]